jgi:hypothetical protein
VEAAYLGQPLAQRQLATLEADPKALAASQLALLATPRGLAAAGAGAAPYLL